MRLFVALDVPDTVRAALAEFLAPLKPLCRGAKWARLESVHVTLKFIGHVPDDRLPPIEQALVAVSGIAVSGAVPFDLRFVGLGFFPDAREPRVFWAGIEAGPQLAALAGTVETALAPLGIPQEERTFQPHLTLARFDSPAGTAALRDAVANRGAGAQSFGSTEISEFYLYRSVLKPSGAEYTRLSAYPLSGESAP